MQENQYPISEFFADGVKTAVKPSLAEPIIEL
jgi:hypothetical protein